MVGVLVRRWLRDASRTGWVALGRRWADATLPLRVAKLPHTTIEIIARKLTSENQTRNEGILRMLLTGLTAWMNFWETLLPDGLAVSLVTRDPSSRRIPALAILLCGLIFRAVL